MYMDMPRSLEPTRDLESGSFSQDEEEEDDSSLSNLFKMEMSISGEPARYLDSGSSQEEEEQEVDISNDDDEASRIKAFRQHLKSCTWRSPCANTLWHGIDISEDPDSYMDETRKHQQAKLARSLRLVNQNRLSTGYNPCKAYASEEQSGTGKEEDVFRQPRRKGRSGRKLVMEKRNRVIELSNVKLTQEACVGTLATHKNGFQFTSDDSRFHLHCLFKDIKASFFALGHDTRLPVLHIHLDTVNEKRKTKDIIFHLLMTSDSEKQQEHKDRNNDLKKFVYDVQKKWMRKEAFSHLPPINEFDGVDCFLVFFQEKASNLELTMFCMVVSVAQPSNETFFVVKPEDIEIVNFHGYFDPYSPFTLAMTVVCKDFKIDSMLEIRISRDSFSDIKSWFHRRNVKYYENNVGNWKSRVKEIAEDFPTFLKLGGWDRFALEDVQTIKDYYSMTSESEYSSDTIWGESCTESDSGEEY